ncbi:MAG: iron ABC transporter permease [Rhodospirillales bacterium]
MQNPLADTRSSTAIAATPSFGFKVMGTLRTWAHEWPRTLVFLVVSLTLAFFILYPLGILVRRSLFDAATQTWSLGNYVTFFTRPALFGAFITTFKLAGFVSFFSLLIALPMAWGVARTNMPYKSMVRALVVLTFATPSFLGAIGWIVLAGPNAGFLNEIFKWVFGTEQGFLNIFSFEGMVFVLSLYVYPFVFFTTASALDNMDPGLEDAGRILGASNLRVTWTITLPVVMPAILSGLVLVILECFVVFGAIAVLGSPRFIYTLSTTVHALFIAEPPQFNMAATAATPIVAVTACLLLFQRLYLGKRKFITVKGQATAPQPVDVGAWRYVLFGFAFTVVATGIFLPWIALLQASVIKVWGLPITWENISLVHYQSLFSSELIGRAFRNSFVLALSAATLAVLLTFTIAWIVERTNTPGKEGLALLAMLPLSFPGVAFGTALVLAFAGGPVPLYGTLWLFLIAYTIKGTPFGFMFARSALKQIHEELEQSSRALGAGWIRTMKEVTIPLVKKGLLSVGTILFAQKFRDAQSSIMLYAGGLEVVSILILDFVEESEMGLLGAMTFLVLCVNFTLIMVSRKLVGKAAFEV